VTKYISPDFRNFEGEFYEVDDHFFHREYGESFCPKVHSLSQYALTQYGRLLPFAAMLVLFLLIPSTQLHAASCWAVCSSSTAYVGGYIRRAFYRETTAVAIPQFVVKAI
jgi:hypothetical protein